MRVKRALLWIDSGAGLTVGILVLLLAEWLSRSYAMPLNLVIGMGAANVGYGLYSFSLARRRVRPRALLVLLVTANASWATLCAVAAVLLVPVATRFGIAVLLLESVFVGGLAALEWRHRESLLIAD